MVITSITEVNKQRSRISLETEESYVLYKGEIRMLKLKEGQELSEEDYDKIMRGILPKRCKMRAMNLLKERRYTSYGLKKKLLDGGYPEEICDEAIRYVSSYGYVNDFAYAMDYIKEQEESRSIREIKQKLMSKGIQNVIIDQALKELGKEREEYNEESQKEIEERLIIKTLEKRNFSVDSSYEDKQKLLAYFYRRGFDIDSVKKAMDRFSQD
ncbi:MAG: recombination regulator RecX [Lachnospiraceae bacterium]|nr:recombination regulator RecX [Lachnospiraceae bacterium]